MQQIRNCGDIRQMHVENSGPPIMFLKGVEIRECPISFITPWADEMLTLFFYCHSISAGQGGPEIHVNALPEQGGLFDQDNLTIESFLLIKSTITRKREKTNAG